MVGSVSHISQPREASGEGVFILGDWRDTHIGFVKAGESREANCKNLFSFCGMNWLLAFPARWDLTHPSHPWAGHGVATRHTDALQRISNIRRETCRVWVGREAGHSKKRERGKGKDDKRKWGPGGKRRKGLGGRGSGRKARRCEVKHRKAGRREQKERTRRRRGKIWREMERGRRGETGER